MFNSRVNYLVSSVNNKSVQAALRNGGAYAIAVVGGSVGSETCGPETERQVINIYAQSLRRCWQVAIGFSLLGFIISLFINDLQLRTSLETEFGLTDQKKDTRVSE